MWSYATPQHSLRTMYALLLRDSASRPSFQRCVLPHPCGVYCIALVTVIWLIHPQGGLSSLSSATSAARLTSPTVVPSQPLQQFVLLEDKISDAQEGLGLPRQVFSASSASASMTSEDGTEWEEDTVSLESSSNDFMTLACKDSSRCGSVESSDRRSTNSSVHRTRSTYSPPNLQPLQDLYNILIRPLSCTA